MPDRETLDAATTEGAPPTTDSLHVLIPIQSLVLTAVVALLLNVVLPWIRRRRRLIELSARLPGPPFVNGEHPHPWLFDVGTLRKLPTVPGRPAIRMNMPYWEKLGREYAGSASAAKNEGDECSSDGIGGDRGNDGGGGEDDRRHGLVRLWAFSPYRIPFARCLVQVFDPDLASDALGPRCYGKFEKGRVYTIARPLVGDSLLALPDGHEWKAQRKLAAPGFGHAVLERTTEIVGRLLVEEVFPLWDDEASRNGFDAMKYICRLTLDVLCEAAFSYSFGGVRSIDPAMMGSSCDNNDVVEKNPEDGEIEESMYHVYETIKETLTVRARSFPLREYLPLEENRRCRVASERLNSTIEKIIQTRLLEQEQAEMCSSANDVVRTKGKGTEKKRDLLAQLLLTDEKGMRLSHGDILGNARMFLFAGHDTTAASLSYAVWHLAKRPDIQNRLHEEVAPLFRRSDSHGAQATYAELRNLPFLDAVIKETLRLYNPVGIARRALCDVTIGGQKEGQKEYLIPKGCDLYVFPWLVHRHPKSLSGGEADFNPDRFLNGKQNGSGEKESSNRFMPFSVGPRNCVGQQLGMAEMRAFLAHVAYRYTFEPVPGAAEPVPLLTMTISPHEVMVRFRRRKVLDTC